MKIWAISDLHLGFSTGKWMDQFGEHWVGHHEKIERAWKERIEPGDLVLLPGDFSWAMKAVDVAVEFEWLDSLPGRKVLIKGNHDYWWPGSHKKLGEMLPEGIYAIKKRAVVVDGVPIIGVRGGDFLPWVAPGEEPAPGTFEKTFSTLQKERRELLQSIDYLAGIYEGDQRPIALFHYPPYRIGSSESVFTRILESRGCSHCLFGHLHTSTEWEKVFKGDSGGVSYRLVSCDYLDFKPVLIDERA